MCKPTPPSEISPRGSLPWQDKTAFDDNVLTRNTQPEIMGLNYVLKLPRPLSNNQAQDIDSLRKPSVAEDLLRLLREEKGRATK